MITLLTFIVVFMPGGVIIGLIWGLYKLYRTNIVNQYNTVKVEHKIKGDRLRISMQYKFYNYIACNGLVSGTKSNEYAVNLLYTKNTNNMLEAFRVLHREIYGE